MRVLITRPEEDNAALAAQLAISGMEVVSEPLLRISPTGAKLDLAVAQAILLTSANGARAVAAATEDRDLPVFAVGAATAAAARAAGFASVTSAGGDVASLAALVADQLDGTAGDLVHAAGSNLAGDLAGSLTAAGFTVRRAVLYEAQAAQSLSEGTKELLRAGVIDGALFFSPRTAQTFVIIVKQTGLVPACAAMAAICLSDAVAATLDGLAWRVVRVAARPEQDALLDALHAEAERIKSG